MIPEFTERQIAALTLTRTALVICDVDEVVVHFTRELEDHLNDHDLYLATDSFALSGNIRRKADHAPIHDDEVMHHIDRVFSERTQKMRAITGAVAALRRFGEIADIVLLTNLPHSAGELRRENMKRHGLPYPVVTNSGPKGPAVRRLAGMVSGPVVFIDDSPQFLASAHADAPDVHLIHFLHDHRFARHIPEAPYVTLRASRWAEVTPVVLGLIA